MQAFRRESRISIIIGIFFTMMFFCGSAIGASSYKIGYVNSHSGFLAHIGSANKEGFLLGVEEINKAGGIDGHQVDVVVYDDESDVTKGTLAFKKLISSDQVLAVVGNNHSGIGIQCAALAEKYKTPYILVGSSRWGVVKPGKWKPPAEPTEVYDYVVKFWLDESAQIPALLAYAKKKGMKKIALMSPGYALGRTAKKFLLDYYKSAGFELVAAEEYGPRDSDMTVQLTKIQSTDFDFLIIYGAEPAGVLTYKQAREMGIKKPILGAISIATRSLLDSLGQHMEGLIVDMFATEAADLLPAENRAMVPVIKKLDQGIRKKYGHRVDWVNGQGYDAALLLFDALKRAKPDPGNIKLARKSIQGALVTTKGFVGTLSMGDMSPIHELPLPIIMVKVDQNVKFIPAD